MMNKAELDTPADKQIPVIMSEIGVAADKLANIGPAVSIFGSARLHETSPHYAKCESVSAMLAQAGFAVIAGGSPGLMEAASKGAYEVGGKSVGLNISLPYETSNNAYQTHSLSFEYFHSRKAAFFMHSFSYVAMPGGFGTLDELFEALTLIQKGKVPPAPIILVGREYWQGLIGWIGSQTLGNKLIGPQDMNLLILEDDPAEVVRLIVQFHDEHINEAQYAPSLPT